MKKYEKIVQESLALGSQINMLTIWINNYKEGENNSYLSKGEVVKTKEDKGSCFIPFVTIGNRSSSNLGTLTFDMGGELQELLSVVVPHLESLKAEKIIKKEALDKKLSAVEELLGGNHG